MTALILVAGSIAMAAVVAFMAANDLDRWP